MNNIKNALRELELALKTAQEGRAFYETKVEQLTSAIAALRGVDAPAKPAKAAKEAVAAKHPAKATKATKAAKATKAKRSKQVDAKATPTRVSKDVPSVGRDVILALVDATPKTRDVLTEQAVAQLQVKPTPQNLTCLRNRLTAGLAALVAANAVQQDGKGRSATFRAAA